MHGYLSIVLHAHLPFVRHPEHEKFLEESWLFEAITETYLPVIQILEGWQRDQVGAKLVAQEINPQLPSQVAGPFLVTIQKTVQLG